jgi:hypothetical protein
MVVQTFSNIGLHAFRREVHFDSKLVHGLYQATQIGTLFRFCVSGDNQPFILERTERLCHFHPNS